MDLLLSMGLDIDPIEHAHLGTQVLAEVLLFLLALFYMLELNGGKPLV